MFNPQQFYEYGKRIYKPFVAIFDTTKISTGSTANTQLKIPFNNSPFFKPCLVEWGDGTSNYITTYNDANVTHTYSIAGVYTVSIKGAYFELFFSGGGDRLKLISIQQFGNHRFYIKAFDSCTNLTSIPNDIGILNEITNGYNLFRNCPLVSIPSTLTFPNLVFATSLFQGSQFTSLPSGILLEKLKNGQNMFYGSKITSLNPLIKLDNLKTAGTMFYDAPINDLPSGVTLKSIITAEQMFNGSGLNTTRYSQLLIDMNNLNPNNNNVQIGFENSKYNSSASAARASLVARGWIITDGGLV